MCAMMYIVGTVGSALNRQVTIVQRGLIERFHCISAELLNRLLQTYCTLEVVLVPKME